MDIFICKLKTTKNELEFQTLNLAKAFINHHGCKRDLLKRVWPR